MVTYRLIDFNAKLVPVPRKGLDKCCEQDENIHKDRSRNCKGSIQDYNVVFENPLSSQTSDGITLSGLTI